MLNIKTLKITKDIPFQMYLLSDRRVKRINTEFAFYNVKIYREEKAKKQTVCLDYPEGNMFWYVDFKKYVISEILGNDPRYQPEWTSLLNKLKSLIKTEADSLTSALQGITKAEVIRKMQQYNLRDYQAVDMLTLLTKMKYNKTPAGLILSEQRTGKTRIAVATCIENLDTGSTILVVCPKSAQSSWYKEFTEMDKYRKTELFKITLIKKLTDLKNGTPYHSDCLNVKIISYGLFKIMSQPQIREMLDISHTKNIMFIGDEAHRLRNFKTMQSDAIFNFKEICVRNKLNVQVLGVTGTPAVKDSSDVFGVFSLINFSKIQFRPYEVAFNIFKEYFYNCEDTSYGKICKSLRRSKELTYLLQSNSVQTKQNNLTMFQGYTKKYLKYTLTTDATQREIYKSVRDTMEFGDDIDCMNGLVQLMRLQQICIDPSGLVSSYDQLAPKLSWVLEFVKKNHTTQMLIMAKKRQPLDKLEELFTQENITYTTYNGSLNLEKRNENVDKFKTGNAQIFLIQLDAGRESLTLPEARCTIFLDRDWAQGYNEQAEARMTPVDGSTCVKYVIDLIMSDTVEEGIYDVLVNRKESIDTVNTIKKII
jgi:SNF2 family DNA or RNA helicase